MSYREKSAWICLLAIVAVQLPYFVHVAALFAHGPVAIGSLMGPFIVATGAQALLTGVAHALVTRQARCERPDERDAAIDSAAFRRGYAVLSAAVFCALFGAFAVDRATGAPALMQLVLLAWVLAEVVKYASRAWDYRRDVLGASGAAG